MTIRNLGDLCRRRDCVDRAFWRGLRSPHWVRWHSGYDALELPDDDSPAPLPQVFIAPIRPGSMSLRIASQP